MNRWQRIRGFFPSGIEGEVKALSIYYGTSEKDIIQSIMRGIHEEFNPPSPLEQMKQLYEILGDEFNPDDFPDLLKQHQEGQVKQIDPETKSLLEVLESMLSGKLIKPKRMLENFEKILPAADPLRKHLAKRLFTATIG